MEFLEFFAGRANLTYACRQKNYKCAKFDILYHDKDDRCTSNYMDLLSAPGFLRLGSDTAFAFS